MSDECIHGTNRLWCAFCTHSEAVAPASRFGEYGFHGGETKQDVLNELCDLLGLPRESVARGSSLPSHVFATAAQRAGVPFGSMPEIGEAIAQKAGKEWGPDCDSRGTLSGGGSTVTLIGLRTVVDALRGLSRHSRGR